MTSTDIFWVAGYGATSEIERANTTPVLHGQAFHYSRTPSVLFLWLPRSSTATTGCCISCQEIPYISRSSHTSTAICAILYQAVCVADSEAPYMLPRRSA